MMVEEEPDEKYAEIQNQAPYMAEENNCQKM